MNVPEEDVMEYVLENYNEEIIEYVCEHHLDDVFTYIKEVIEVKKK
jgi:hypothetical protein